MFRAKYIINWHFILFGILGGGFLPILLMGYGNGGEFLDADEIIGEITRGAYFDEDFTTSIVGLFAVGLVINLIISTFKFKNEILKAVLTQFFALAGTIAAMSLICLFFTKILTIICVILGAAALLGFLFQGRTRMDALWDLVYIFRDKEVRMTSEQKRDVEARAMDAAMNQSKDEYDTSDIDDIMNDYHNL